jgi:hypothetical protein
MLSPGASQFGGKEDTDEIVISSSTGIMSNTAWRRQARRYAARLISAILAACLFLW